MIIHYQFKVDTMTLKSNLKKLRSAKDLTQTELAELSSVSMTQISKIERGESDNPELGTIKKLCVALKCSADDLLFDRKLSSSSATLQRYFDKAMMLSPNDKAILINVVHKFLMADDLAKMHKKTSPTDVLNVLQSERFEDDMNSAEGQKRAAIKEHNKEKAELEQEQWESAQE